MRGKEVDRTGSVVRDNRCLRGQKRIRAQSLRGATVLNSLGQTIYQVHDAQHTGSTSPRHSGHQNWNSWPPCIRHHGRSRSEASPTMHRVLGDLADAGMVWGLALIPQVKVSRGDRVSIRARSRGCDSQVYRLLPTQTQVDMVGKPRSAPVCVEAAEKFTSCRPRRRSCLPRDMTQ